MANYDEIAKQLRKEQDQSVGTSLYNAADANPDHEGFITKLSKRTGIPVTSLRVKELEQDAVRLDVANKYDAIIKNSPNLANWLSADQQNANIAHDDTENLGLIETSINSLRRGFIGLMSMPDTLQAMNTSEGLAQLDYVDEMLGKGQVPDPMRLGVLGEQYARMSPEQRLLTRQKVSPGLRRTQEAAVTGIVEAQAGRAALPVRPVAGEVAKAETFGQAIEALGQDPLGFLMGVGPESLVQSLPSLAAAVPAGMAAGPAGVAAAMGTGSMVTDYANQVLNNLQESGININDPEALRKALQTPELMRTIRGQAATHAAVVGAFDALSGGVASKTLLPATALAERPFAREIANIAVQAPVQGLLGAAGEAGGTLAAGQEVKPGEVLGEFFGEFFGAPVEVLTASANRLREQFKAADEAENTANVFAELDKVAAASKVRQRDTDTFEQFVKQAAEDGPVQDVYIDAQALLQSGVADQLAVVSPSVAEQLQPALAVGGSIRIPLDEYMGRIAGTELSQPLLNDLKTTPDGFSKNEAQEFLQTYGLEVQREIEQVLSKATDVTEARASAKAVEDRVFNELQSAGRFSADVNRSYAQLQSAFAATMANKLGMTPEQFFDKHLLRVVNRALDGKALDQELVSIPKEAYAAWDVQNDAVFDEDGNETAGEDYVLIEKLFVPEANRKGGVGRALLRKTLRDIQSQHPGLDIKVAAYPFGEGERMDMQDLVSFYESEGFDVENTDGHAVVMKFDGNIRGGSQQINQSAKLPDTIEVDGQQRSTTNSKGQPIATTEEGVRNFWQWFGDSKVVDDQGRPLVVYHGTGPDGIDAADIPYGGMYLAYEPAVAQAYADLGGGSVDGTVESLYAKTQNIFDAEGKNAATVLDKIEAEYDNGTDYKDPDDGEYMPLRDWVRTGYLFKLGRNAQNEVMEALRAEGYDGVSYKDASPMTGDSLSLVIFDPTQIKSATGNVGTFDPSNANILMQSAKGPLGEGEVKRVLQREPGNFTPEEQAAFDEFMATRPDADRIMANLKEHKGTPWAKQAVEGVFTRQAMRMLVEGREPNFQSSMDSGKVARTRRVLAERGIEGMWQLIEADGGLMGGAGKPVNNVNSSFINCDPSSDCAKYCYATRGNYQYSNVIVKSELVTLAVELDPVRAAQRVAQEYKATAEFVNNKALRLFDKGDGNAAWLPFIKALNKQGIRTQIFSKVPEFLRQVPDMNLRLLSIDNSNMAMADANPDLPVAFVYTDNSQLDMLAKLAERQQLQVVLPVKLGKKLLNETQIAEIKKEVPKAKPYLCPIDSGFKELGKSSQPGKWNCTKCDVNGGVGCFHGTPTKAVLNSLEVKPATPQERAKRILELRNQINAITSGAGTDVAAAGRVPPGRAEGLLREVDALLGELLRDYEPAGETGTALEIGAGTVSSGAGTQGGVSGPAGRRIIPIKQLNQFAIDDGSGVGTDQTARGEALEQPARGSFNPATNTIALLKAADLSTFLHESGHFFLETQFKVAADLMAEQRMFGQDPNQPGAQQILDDTNAILKWFGINSLDEWFTLDFEEQRAYHEKFAESFEAYLFDGKAPSIELQGAFQRFRSWLVSVYKSLKDFITRNPAAGQLNDEVRQVMDRMLATDEQIALAEQARSMMPLFTSAKQAGMTVDEFAAYQSLGDQATADAAEELQAKSLRDLQWFSNTKQREVRKLKKLSAQRRSELRIDARREVMSQPIYQAWQFLTNKLTADDKLTPKVPPKPDPNRVQPEMDSLFTAIAKLGGLDRQEVADTWGWDERVPVPVFGKPLLRREGGRSIDAMVEALGELGYLTLDKNGKADVAELEEKFDDERRGTLRYSNALDPALIMPDESRAGEGINTDALGAGRFDIGELRDMGIPPAITDLIVGLKMTAKTGLHPDIVAERFGFSSGDELVRSLAFAEDPKVAIEALTDAKMLEQYGELSSPEAIEREADKAIHNDLRARMLATEANALAKATGQRKILAPAAKEFAAQMVARLLVRNVKPSQYTAAEVRAAKAAEKASRAGKLTEAAAEKRNQLVNVYAARAAYQALEDVERGVRYLRKFEREATRNAIATEYVEQIDALLERFDLRKQSLKAIDKRASLAAWIESQRAMGLEPNIPEDIANEAMRKSYKDMTVEEFRGLIDTVRQIEHLGRLKERLLTAKDLREFKAVRDLIANSIKDNAGNREAVTREARTTMERVQQTARRFGWAHIKANTIARILDGGKDGGPVWEYFIRSANERGDFEVEKRAKATEDITRILEPVFKLGNMGGKGQFFPSIGQSLNREARIALALNTGNEGNLQRLLGGEGWTMQQIQPVLQSLTAAEWQTVQNIWDYFESYRPEIAAKEKRVYGKEPNWVEPKGFTITTADGQQVELKGGYYPIKYDPNASQRAEEHADADAAKRQLQGAYTSATTRRSFTKARAEEVSGRPLLLSLEGVYSGLNEVIHDLAWHEWLIDANRLLRSETIDSAIRQHYGPEVKAQLKNWVKDVAEGDRPAANAAESALSRLRQGVSAAGLGFNVMNAMMQVTGFIPAGVRIGWEWVGKGAARYIGGPITATTQANELSSFMKNRARTRLRELAEVRNRVQDANQTFTKVNELAYFMMLRTQQVVDTVTWWGAFEKALAAGQDEDRAIGMADQAVLDSQGGGQLKDLSAVERGGPALKLFTVYYSYMNTMLNLGTAEQMTNKQRGKRLANQLLIFTVAPMLGLAIKEGLTPGGEDDEFDMGELAKKMAAEQIAFLMGLMVVVREFSEASKMVAGVAEYSRDYGGPAGLRAIAEVNRLATQANQGEVDEAFVRASINTIGALTGLPAAQVNRTIAGAQALAEDETDNPAALLLGVQK